MSIFKKNSKKIIIIIAALLLVSVICCGIYLGDYYRADKTAIEAFSVSDTVRQMNLEDGNIAIEPNNACAGLIFYPGGKVEHTTYIPLMKACAAKGILCIITEMPFNLAVFDINAADGITQMYPDIENWYIGGHSLGGSMAASYLKDKSEFFDGLILLGSYSTEDFSDTSLEVLSVYGSEDKVLNSEKYAENKANLPESFTEVIIDGGCHAYFGMYGHQEGDGTPTITNEEQILKTAETIAEFIKDKG